MGKKDPRIDAYIAKSADFAKPVLRHLRKVVHAGCPDVEETLKWGMPAFMYKGILCGMAAFKGHCTFGFWKETLLKKKYGPLAKVDAKAMGQFGRITGVADLPSERTLLRFVKDAAALNDAGVKVAARPKTKKPLAIPTDFMAALRKNKKALATFEGFSPSHKREYVEWVTEAKGEDTRARRLATAVAWMADGKVRNWKYVGKC